MEGVKVTAFQLGHFLAEMDREWALSYMGLPKTFQLGHFLAEMDRAAILRPLQLSK